MKKTRCWALLGTLVLAVGLLGGCGSTQEKRIVRIGHNQSENHPSHKGMVAFEEFIDENIVRVVNGEEITIH